MKKAIDKILDILLIFSYGLLIYSLIYTKYDYKYFESETIENLKNYEYINGIYIDKGIEYPNEGSVLIKEGLSLGGDLYKMYLKDNGYVILTKDLTEGLIGNIQRKYKHNVIKIQEQPTEWYKKTSLHELGHYLDYKTNKSSHSLKFTNLYNKYKNIIYELDSEIGNEEYIISTREEFYAEMYSCYILEKEKLKDVSPEIYEYIQKDVKGVKDKCKK